MHVIRRLLKPLLYLQIQHPEKQWWDYWLPILFSGVVSLIVWLLPNSVNVFGANGLIDGINNLLQMLIGFYIAALAALATFERPSLDERFDGRDILVPDEKGKLKILTRRQFLCLLFGYLSLLSIILFLIGLSCSLIASNLVGIMPLNNCINWKLIYLFIYLVLFMNLITSTLVGLFYLSYKIHEN